jgi:acetyl-CoA carboxylase carboxyltransferase component
MTTEISPNRAAMLAKLADLEAEHARAVAGGGKKYVDRHHARGRLMPRERIELLVDPGSAFLELSPLAGWGSDFAVGASVVTGIGVVEGVECVITANDPTVKGGASNPWTLKKVFRASQIAEENNLPTISLVESAGADLPTQKEIFIPGGKLFRDLTRASARKSPTVALVFGNSTAGGAYVPGMSDYTVMVKGQAKVFLGGPPLVKMATGEEADDESLGGADMHARVSGLADYLADDELDAIRIGRRIVARLNRSRRGGGFPGSPGNHDLPGASSGRERHGSAGNLGPGAAPLGVTWAEPDQEVEELLDLIPSDLREPFDPREVIVRIVDGSGPGNAVPFDEFKPLYGASLVTGWARIHGRQIGILANAQGVLFSEEAQKATQFIQLANQVDTPLLFLHNTTGYMVGAEYEQGGIIKHGAQMINAVSNSTVPHLSVIMGASYGAGNYGMNGRAYDPRFLFTWPSAKSAVMGPAQLAGVLSIVARDAAQARGQEYDEKGDAEMRAFVERTVEEQSLPFFLSGMLYDDGVIDPRDTRTVLAICLSVIENAPIRGTDGYGVFRT